MADSWRDARGAVDLGGEPAERIIRRQRDAHSALDQILEDNARLEAENTRLQDALADLVEEDIHVQRTGSRYCDYCGLRWPCPHARGLAVLNGEEA